jgi:hypothetical protein
MQNWEMLQKAYYRKVTTRGVLKQAVIKGRIREEEFDRIMADSPFPEDQGRVFNLSSQEGVV